MEAQNATTPAINGIVAKFSRKTTHLHQSNGEVFLEKKT